MWNRSSSRTEIPDKEPAVGVIDADPLRAELYSRDQLVQHAKETASSYQIDTRKGHERLLPRLGANERILLETHALLSTVIEKNQRIAPAGEWLLDNFYLIEEQIRTARRHLTKEYSKELPHLVNGPFEGYPRVYQIARELIAHSDGRIDSESLFAFINAYQSVTPLMLGELWAVPIMLRLSLIENLRRISDILSSNKQEIDSANEWVERITKVAKEDPKSLILVIADLARSNPPLTSAFVAEIARQLQGQSGTLAFPLTWIEQRLFESNLTIEQMINAETQTQAADQVSIGNSIGSLRLLDKMNWREFIEQVSLVEQILRSDHEDVYAGMDFETRDQYRHVIEDIGKKGAIEESKIALKAVELARKSRIRGDPIASRSHVGYYLIDKGRHSLEEAVGYQLSLRDRLLIRGKSNLLLLYLTGILFVTIIVEIFGYSRISGAAWYLLLPFLALLLIPVSQASITLGNWFTTILITPVPLPKMTYSSGIPDDQKTIVVIPTVVSGTADAIRLLDALEIRYLGNRDENLFFALLTDLRNADARELPDDADIVSVLTTGIEELNARYYGEKPGVFYLMHRSRSWNCNEGRWMGYERKRGILEAFSILISGKGDDLFSHISGDLSRLSPLKYVITLDADTQLPRNSARDLIGAISHPLNHPVADPKTEIIREGYGILQPRVSLSVSESGFSHYASIFGGERGIDPYTRTVSDVYQDAFHEGSFIGKGIYDLEVFSRSVEGQFPDNLILSHDLLEGCYVRTALVSDIQVFEEYPVSYIADIRRRHRWVRGDWQIGSWIFSSVTDNAKNTIRNPLSLLSRWKIFDNLRRSLVAPASFLLLCITWLLVPNSLYLTGFIVSLTLIPPVILTGWKSIKKPSEHTWRLHLHDMVRVIRDQLAAPLLTLVFLPFEACIYLDAILRSSWRMGISHHHLLEWTTHQEVGQAGHADIKRSYQIMWPGPVIGIGFLIFLFFHQTANAPVIMMFVSAWILSPALAWWISLPVKSRISSLTPGQVSFLRETARRTWRFFETFVTAEDHYLITDNYQEHPVAKIAHRTSPTNIGLSLLASLTAYDFGYIPAGELLSRTQNTMNTLGKLKKFRGHFFNWYDTLTLEPLLPWYVSTVDSGNLVSNLLVLTQALNEIPENRVFSESFGKGIEDTIHILSDAIGASHPEPDGNENSGQMPIMNTINELKQSRILIPGSIRHMMEHLTYLEKMASDIEGAFSSHPDDEIRWWSAEITRQIHNHRTDVLSFISWNTADTPPITLNDEIPPDLDPELRCFYSIWENLNSRIPTIREVATLQQDLQAKCSQVLTWADASAPQDDFSGPGRSWLVKTLREMQFSSGRASKFLSDVEDLIGLCNTFSEIEYEFLYDRVSNLLSVGYNVTDLRLDPVWYDLLASEARITSFIGIATGHLPQKHWFALGRLLTTTGGANATLISWSGSMFEYLMPLLIMPTYENSLLDSSYHTVVTRQIEYGRKHGVPWGISESGYNLTDTTLNYQYRAFGVPGLGFKRGLAGDLVVAPYAAAMGLMINPNLACGNLIEMKSQGFTGDYGFYEAIDYTPSRIIPGKTHAVVQSFMAHHQGMILLSIAYSLLNHPMQRRFESDPRLQATIMLLQEKMPRHTPFFPHSGKEEEIHTSIGERESQIRVFRTYQTPWPEVHLLSNGRYHVMINNSGSGYSRWNDLAMTRWREDPTTDSSGTFCFIRDLASGEFWSNGYMPSAKTPDAYQVIFKQARAEFQRRDQEFETRSEIIVSPEDDVELRRIRVTNHSHTKRVIEFTSYSEVVLAFPASDESHPAFSNLFVQTELFREKNAIIVTRRARSEGEHPPWMFHLMTIDGTQVRPVSYETDRSRFIGRINSLSRPVAMTDSSTLSDMEGSVLDPIVAIRCTISLDPQETAGVNIFTGVSDTRSGAISLIEKYYDRHMADRVSELAWTHAQIMLRQLNATEQDAQLFCTLASSILYANPSRRTSQNVILKNNRGQSSLWGYGISGDVPIALVRIQNRERIDLIKEMVQAHAYWRTKGLVVDLVIWNEDQSGYRQDLQDEIMLQIPPGSDSHVLNSKGGIFIRHLEQMSEEDRILILTVARVIITDKGGTIAEQMERTGWKKILVPKLLPTRTPQSHRESIPEIRAEKLHFFNGTGGFSENGKEYVIYTKKGKTTPAPWVNVLANENFGTVVSENGSVYTWNENAHEFRLTPWMNDPVRDLSGEALYIRDEETGMYWSPTPLPAQGGNQYVTRHGFGYSTYDSCEYGITTRLTIFVSIDKPVKYVSLRIRNRSGHRRLLSVTGYLEWVLGELRSKSLLYVITEIDPKSGALFAKNPYNHEFPGRVAFLDSNILNRTVTGDRYEFIGRNGSRDKPQAMEQVRLSNKVGAGLDACAAMQVLCELTDGEEREIIFTLGAGKDIETARDLVRTTRGVESAHASLKAVKEYWSRTLGAVKVTTPDLSVDLLVNGWLLYQTMAFRLWGRTGFYQSGGAFGYRDQLQDVLALIHTRPELIRKQLLLCAEHQFHEGDVQHWWHPPLNRGVRTHCSDDYLWLPYTTCRYVLKTRDTGILDEQVSYLEGRIIPPEDDSYYDLPYQSGITGTLYEHCVRAIRLGMRTGVHGLPLIGSGDWNDGMNLIGSAGKGESIWLGFFIYDILMQYQKIATLHSDTEFAEFCRMKAEEMQKNLEEAGWDGEWYRRAYFDSGEPLGSSQNTNCMIDSLAQSWAVLSGAGSEERTISAMEAVKKYLIHSDDRLITLLTPPFDTAQTNPGYIKGYVPGIRENGGHYSHAAMWVVMAYAALNDHEQAWSLMSHISPIHHSSTLENLGIYRVEPYLVASDIYSTPPHTGRGGWTGYTGSAGLMYTLILESLLGVHLYGDQISIDPCIPDNWPSYQIEYHYRSTTYIIVVKNSGTGIKTISVDGNEQADSLIRLVDDQKNHQIIINLSK